MKEPRLVKLNDFISSKEEEQEDHDDSVAAASDVASLTMSPSSAKKTRSKKHENDSMLSVSSLSPTRSSNGSSSRLKCDSESCFDTSERSKRSKKSSRKPVKKESIRKKEKTNADYDEKCFEEIEVERRLRLANKRSKRDAKQAKEFVGKVAKDDVEQAEVSKPTIIPETEETACVDELKPAQQNEKLEGLITEAKEDDASEEILDEDEASEDQVEQQHPSTATKKDLWNNKSLQEATSYSEKPAKPNRTIEWVPAVEEQEVEPLDVKALSKMKGTKANGVSAEQQDVKEVEQGVAETESSDNSTEKPPQNEAKHHASHPKLRLSDTATDEDSTLASTVTGQTGPVSYVEFANLLDGSNVNLMMKPLDLDPSKPSFPDDTKLGAIPKLLAVDVWSNDESQVLVALDKLADLCVAERNLSEIQKHGGHLTLTVVLRKWSTSAAVQSAALNTLHKAAESIEFSNAVVQLGALDLVVTAMKNHMNEEVVTAGCAALLNLTLPASAAKILVFELQGIQTISAACAAFPNNMTLQKYALWIIQYMSYWDDFKAPIVAAGGLHALAEMMESFAASRDNTENIQKSARATMKRLL